MRRPRPRGTGDVLAADSCLRAQGVDAYERPSPVHDPRAAGLYAADDMGTTASVLAGDVLDSVSDVLSDLE